MSDLTHNVSYIIIPFLCEGKNPLDTIQKDMENAGISFEKLVLTKGRFCGYIDALFETVLCGIIKQSSDDVNEIRLCLFKTGIGFFSFNYLYKCNDITVADQAEDINSKLVDIKQGKYKLLNDMLEKMPSIIISQSENNMNVFAYNIIISKVGNQAYDYINADAERNYNLDKMHECWCSSRYTSLISNQHYNNLLTREEDRLFEQNFRDRYEESLWMILLLLHHERQAYLIYRRAIVSQNEEKKRNVKTLKRKIIDLLTCYSFKLVSEESNIQKLYSEYREVLELSDYEQALSELVFRLNDELDKNKENKITTISLLIAIFGLFQLISVILDIISFITSH